MRLWGSYLSKRNVLAGMNLDFYYLGLWKKLAHFDDGTGQEFRHSVGSRLWGSNGEFGYDVEGVMQLGRFEKRSISAWTTSVHLLYQFKDSWLEPKAGLKTELISGDMQSDDNRLQTFNPLFPRGAYFGLAALIGPANLFDIHPSVNLSLSPKLEWGTDYGIFWRFSNRDGIYAPNVSLIYSGKVNSDKFIGQQISTDLTFRPHKYFEIVGEFTWFKVGKFLKKVSPGKNILFGGLTLQLTL